MTVQHSLPFGSVEHGARKPTESGKRDRVFVPLADAPFRWFASGRKCWELRRLGRQYTEKHLQLGRRVELRRGYSDKVAALWGKITEVRIAENVPQFLSLVDFKEVIPEAADRDDAVRIASAILRDASTPVIGFRIEPDPVTELPLHSEFVPLVRAGKKRSTVRKGIRKIESALADLVAGSDRVRVLVTDMDVKPYMALSTTDARRDGFETLADLQTALHRFYPNIAPSDPVTIIGFEPLLDE
jgi:ASCH domain